MQFPVASNLRLVATARWCGKIGGEVFGNEGLSDKSLMIDFENVHFSYTDSRVYYD